MLTRAPSDGLGERTADHSGQMSFSLAESPCRREGLPGAEMGSRFVATEQFLQPYQQVPFNDMNFVLGIGHCKEGGAVYFWKFLLFAGFWRPFHRKRVAAYSAGVAIALKRPRQDDFPALIFHAAQRLETSSGLHPRLFLELAPASFLIQYGPPGWTSNTSSFPSAIRYSTNPALCLAIAPFIIPDSSSYRTCFEFVSNQDETGKEELKIIPVDVSAAVVA